LLLLWRAALIAVVGFVVSDGVNIVRVLIGVVNGLKAVGIMTEVDVFSFANILSARVGVIIIRVLPNIVLMRNSYSLIFRSRCKSVLNFVPLICQLSDLNVYLKKIHSGMAMSSGLSSFELRLSNNKTNTLPYHRAHLLNNSSFEDNFK